jgi:hypothetical protein
MADEIGIWATRVTLIVECEALDTALIARYETVTSGWGTRRH